MRLFQTFTSRNYVTLILCAIAMTAFLAAGLTPVSGSKAVPLPPAGVAHEELSIPRPGFNAEPATDSDITSRPGSNDPFKLRLRSASFASPFAAMLTATKTDSFTAPVNPGDTIMYTIVITNTGDANATNVTLSDTIDSNTTLVAGSVKASPIAVNDGYNTIGNVNISIAAGQGVISNDINPNGSGTLEVTMVNATAVPSGGMATAATTNGSVTIHSDGSFDYAPNAGFAGPTDSFTYTLGNGTGKTDTATVTITFSGLIWFVDNSAGPAGDGRLGSPFRNLVGGANPLTGTVANDAIFIYTGSGNYTGGLTLTSGEKVIGQGATQSILTITGFTAPSGPNMLPATGGTNPVITTAGATAITLGTNNGLHGFTVGDTTATGTDISGSTFGNLTVRSVTVNGTGRALNLATGTIVSGSTFPTIESNGGSPAEGVRLNAVGGSFTATTTNIVNPTGTGIDVQGATSGTSFSFGATTVNKGASTGTGVNLATNQGTFSFSSLAVTTSSGTGVSATSSGTVNVTTGSISATGGPALLVNPTIIGMTFTTVSSTNSATTGISLTGASGSLTITTTTSTNPTGIGISVDTSSATINFGNASSTQSGGAGVSLTTNTGPITFTTLNVNSPDANQRGVLATENSGTITINSAATVNGGTVSTSGATAVEISKTTGATPLNITLRTVSANGGNNGIVLSNTSGSFTVTGDGGGTANGSGGTIQNMNAGADGAVAGRGVSLNNAQNVSLTAVNLHDFSNFAIRGFSVTGFTLNRSVISGTNGNSGGAADEAAISFDNLLGSASISNTSISHGFEFIVRVVNSSGTLNRLTMDSDSFGSNNATLGGDAVQVVAQNTATANVTVSNSTFVNAREDLFNALATQTANMDVVFRVNTLSNSNAPALSTRTNALLFSTSTGTVTYDFSCNKSTGGNDGPAIAAAKGTPDSGSGGTMTGSIVNNTIGASGVADSGSISASGIFISSLGSGTHTTLISNNTIKHYDEAGIFMRANDGSSTLNATVTGNVANEPDSNAFAGFHADCGTLPGDTNVANILVGSAATAALKNDFSAGDPNNATDVDILELGGSSVINLSRAGSASGTAAGVIQDDNTGTTTVQAFGTINLVATSPATPPAVASCVAPASLAASGGFKTQGRKGSGPKDKDDLPSNALVEGNLRSTWGEGPNADTARRLSKEELAWFAQAAIQRWKEAGISDEDLARLQGVTFEVADLPGGQIASASGTVVQIDDTGDGYGWFTDISPDSEFEFEVPVPGREVQTVEDSAAHGLMDLMTVLMRQLGYVYLQGKEVVPTNLLPLMEPTLSPSVRRLPDLNKAQVLTSSNGNARRPVEPNVASAVGAESTTENAAPRQTTGSFDGLKPAVFNPNETVRPGAYERSARRMSYNPGSPRAASPMAGETVNLGPFTIPPGESVTIMYSVTVNTPVSPITTAQVCNQGTVTADGGINLLTDDPDVGGAADPTCTPLSTADLEIVSKTDDVDPVPAGDNLTYTINFKNNGPDASINVKVTDPIPANTTFVSVGSLPAGWTRTDSVPVGGTGTITFEKASVANAETATFTITVNVGAAVPGGTTLSNTASTTSDKSDTNQANNSKTETTGVTAQADLAITKTDGVTTLIPGNPTTYTIVVTNNGPNVVNGATVTDTFPAALTGVTFTSVAAGGATGNTASGMGNLNETLNLPVNSTVTYTVTGTVDPAATGSLSNTATVGVPSGISDPTPGNNSATDTDTLTPQGDVSITKTDGSATEVPGTTVTYTIVVSNSGPSTATGAAVADTFPATITGVTYTSVAGGGATGNTASGMGNISDTLTLPPGGSVTYTATGTIDAAATGTLSNTATVTPPGGFDTNAANDTATDSDTLVVQSDLSITKTDGVSSAVPGQMVTYTIVVTNSGPSAAVGATVADTFPASLTVSYTSVPAGGATGNTASGSGNIADTVNMPPGSSITYTATCTIDAAATGSLANTATVTSSTDPDNANNTATDTDTLTPQGDLSITKTDGAATAVPGTMITYTIVVANVGSSTATGATVADTFPAVLTGVTYASVAAGGATGNTASGSGNINDSVTMPPGSSITYTVQGTINSAATGSLSNTATVTAPAGFTDTNPANNSATDTDTLTPMADLAIVKSDSPDPVAAGTNLTYTLSLTNNGPSDAASVMVSDPLPASFVALVSVTTPAGWTRTDAVPVGGTGTITFTKASVASGETATFTIVVAVSPMTPDLTMLSNTAMVSGATTDPTPGNNSSTATTTVRAQADLAVMKTDSPDPACVEEDLTYTIGLANAGPGPGINTVVSDPLPAGTRLVSVTTPMGWMRTDAVPVDGNGTITFTRAAVAVGEMPVFTIVVKVNAGTMHGTVIMNTASVTSSTPDPAPANNSSTSSTTVDETPPTISCPANVTAVTNPNVCQQGGCQVVNYATPTATDNCSGVQVVCVPPSGTCLPTGSTTVTCTATDMAGNTASCSFSVTVFDVCLQDDSSPSKTLLFNSQTGDYVFCCSGTAYSGKGTVSVKGCLITLSHSAGDRRVSASIDKTQFRGTASLQTPPGVLKCSITDKDTRNNSCLCQ